MVEIVLLVILVAVVLGVVGFYLLQSRKSGGAGVSKRIGNLNVRRAAVKKNVSFWDDLSNSHFYEWAQLIANRFGRFVPHNEELLLLAERAAIPVSGAEYIFLCTGFAIFDGIIFFLLTMDPRRSVIVTIFVIGLSLAYLKIAADKRSAAFNSQLNDAVLMMSNALKAGYTFQQAMDVVAQDLGDPISTEFNRALNELRLGVSLEEALNGICKRIASDDFEMITTAVIIQRQVGGNLATILDTIGVTIRERLKLKLEIKSLTSESIMTGWMLALLPVLVGGALYMMNPKHFDPLINASFGKYVFIGCAISECIGGYIIKRLVDFKV